MASQSMREVIAGTVRKRFKWLYAIKEIAASQGLQNANVLQSVKETVWSNSLWSIIVHWNIFSVGQSVKYIFKQIEYIIYKLN